MIFFATNKSKAAQLTAISMIISSSTSPGYPIKSGKFWISCSRIDLNETTRWRRRGSHKKMTKNEKEANRLMCGCFEKNLYVSCVSMLCLLCDMIVLISSTANSFFWIILFFGSSGIRPMQVFTCLRRIVEHSLTPTVAH